jgi:long-chain acyl-CoA synthetase
MLHQEALNAAPPAGTLPGPRGGLKIGPANDRLTAYLESLRTHGDVVCVSEERRLFLISHPEHVKHVLQDNQAGYRQNVRKKVLLGRQSLALSEGEAWRQRRRLLQPLFHPNRLAPLAPGMVAGTKRMLDRWPAGRPVDISREMAALTLDLLIEGLLGSGADRRALRRSVSTAFEYFNDRSNRGRALPLWVPTPRNLGMIGALRGFAGAVRRSAAEHQVNHKESGGEPERDLLTMMLAAHDEQSGQVLNPEQLQDEIMMLLVMGHMTTAMAATWVFVLLARQPAAEARLRAEIAEVVGDRPAELADVQRLVYTRMVIEETLRLYPPSWSFSRVALADDEIGGYRIPAGSVLSISPWVTHRRPELWPDAERFDPERWKQGRAAERPRFAYYPFGGGPRSCIARSLAMMELPLVLATVFQRYRLRAVPGDSTAPVTGIVLRPRSAKMLPEDPAAPAPRREQPFQTVPEMLLLPPAALAGPAAPAVDAPALLDRAGGRSVPVSRAELIGRVRRLAQGLAAMGVAPGERLALLAGNGPDWVAADLAGLAAGAVTAPLPADLETGEAVRALAESGARHVLADAGRLGELLARRAELPEVRSWVQLGGGEPAAGTVGVTTLRALLEQGAAATEAGFAAQVRQRRPEDPATLLFTPGTAGAPKAVELTHANLAAAVLGLAQAVPIRPGDTVLSYLPLARPAERTLLHLCLHRGAVMAWAGSPETLDRDLAEVQPHVLSTAPDFWKRLLNWLFQTVQASSPRRRQIFQRAVQIGRMALPFRQQHRQPPGVLGFYLRLADRFVFKQVRRRLGGRFRFALSGTDRIPHGWITFLWAAGIPVYESYGLSEAAGVVAVNTPQAVRPGSSGVPLPGVEIRIAGDGEILVRGDAVARQGRPLPAVDEEGWLHTGDAGWIDDAGMLAVLGRQADLFAGAGGKKVSPAGLECLLRSSHFVTHAVVVGEGRATNAALLVPDFGDLERVARRRGIAFSTPQELVRDARVRELIAKEVQGFNDKLAAHDRIEAWELLPQGFSVAGGELTATGTLRRAVVLEKYAREIERLYGG